MSRPVELLAPAKNISCGMAAIDSGADAVYIGAERFGARAAAGNPVCDIRRLCGYAHTFGAKVYVTVNTILYDEELEPTRQLIWQLYDAGVDAILVQDMAILRMELPPIALHASTQTDNRTAVKAEWLADNGFSRVVLARELSADEIAAIHRAVPQTELEVFVHGALCVSYSGLCYASQYCFGRSANRGECAQFCRMKFDLIDSAGNTIEHDRHLLSLKDLCQIDKLETLIQAGATSFKIEGRLKDESYVRNVTAAYSQRLNDIISRHPHQYHRASEGRCTYAFSPNLNKTFNRGFTHYFINGRQPDIASFDTPKAIGEYVGKVKEIRGSSFNVAGTASFANGDGLCFINSRRELEGFRVNRAEGNRIFPLNMPKELRPGMPLYRNKDVAFERLLAADGSKRKLAVTMTLAKTAGGISLTATAGDTEKASITADIDTPEAMKPQRDNIVRQLSKLGNTPFECTDVRLTPDDFNFFIPSSVLSDLRRKVTDELLNHLQNTKRGHQVKARTERKTAPDFYPRKASYLYNVSNRLSESFYREEKGSVISEAFELKTPRQPLLMQCRHCIRYALGYCVKHGGRRPTWQEPLFLKLGDGRKFRLQFNCNECQMNVYGEQ